MLETLPNATLSHFAPQSMCLCVEDVLLCCLPLRMTKTKVPDLPYAQDVAGPQDERNVDPESI